MSGYVEYGRMHVVNSDGSHSRESVLLRNDDDWIVRITRHQDDSDETFTSVKHFEAGEEAMSHLLTSCGWGYIVRPELDTRL